MLGVVVVAVTAVRDEVGFEAPVRVRQPAAPRRIGPDHDGRPRKY